MSFEHRYNAVVLNMCLKKINKIGEGDNRDTC